MALAAVMLSISGSKAHADNSAHLDSLSLAIMVRDHARQSVEALVEGMGGKLVDHVLERGESWSTLSQMYNADVGLLRALNPDLDECIAGYEIHLPIFANFDGYEQEAALRVDSRFQQAEQLYSEGDYKAADRLYNLLQDEGNTDLLLPMRRAMAFVQRGKNKQALEQLEIVKIADTENRFPEVDELYDQLVQIEAEKAERRAEFWEGVGEALMAAVAITADAYLQSQNQQAYAGTGYGNSYASPDNYSNKSLSPSLRSAGVVVPDFLDPRKIAQNYDFTPQITYDQWGNPMYSSPGLAAYYRDTQTYAQQIMAQNPGNSGLQAACVAAMAQAQLDYNIAVTPMYPEVFSESPSSATDDSESDDSSYGYTPSGRKIGHYDSNYGDKDCHICHGTGICPSCHGTGILRTPYGNTKCPNCEKENGYSTGRCGTCHGKGKVYGILQ